MKAVGLITEYNPFHKGHALHIQKALALTGADVCVVVMSGNFVQRGEPAIIDKYERASVAVHAGVSLVVELPVRFATASAEKFASGAVQILNSLGVSSICFGSECGDIDKLKNIAEILSSEPDEFSSLLKAELREGYSYPAAREKALIKYGLDPEISNIISLPNNILGIEYIKSILRNAYKITPITFKRDLSLSSSGKIREELTSKYLSEDKDSPSEGSFLSSLDINSLSILSVSGLVPAASQAPYDLSDILSRLPEKSGENISEHFGKIMPVTFDDFSLLLNYKLKKLIYDAEQKSIKLHDLLLEYEGVNDAIAGRISTNAKYNLSVSDRIKALKDKSITYTSISRCLLHILLDIKKEKEVVEPDSGYSYFVQADPTQSLEFSPASDTEPVSYIRILGMDDKGKEFLNSAKKTCPLPIINKVAGNEELLSEDLFSGDIYSLIVHDKFKISLPNELQRGIYIKGKGFTGKDY